MAKALVLSEEALAVPVSQPRAAQVVTPAAASAPAPKVRSPKAPTEPLQIRIPKMRPRRSGVPPWRPTKPSANSCLHAFMPA